MREPAIDHVTAPRLYWGWFVAAASFFIGMCGFGFGFYGPGIYLVTLRAAHGWSIDELSAAITLYYAFGAVLLFLVVGPLFDRWGARTVVTIGTLAMACGLVLLTRLTKLWEVYAVFGVMSLGWATMSGAAINIIVAPWFERRRGLALSWAMSGGSAGGVVIAPLLVLAISRLGFALGLQLATAMMLVLLVPVVQIVLRPMRSGEHDPAEKYGGTGSAAAAWRDGIAKYSLPMVLRSRAFVTTSVPFALALVAQVGFLTHQVAFLSPSIGAMAAGWAVSLTTLAAVLGRIVTGAVIDRCDRRSVASVNFTVQALGIGVLAATPEPRLLYLGCVLFGVGVGNTATLPGLIVQQEFPRRHFARVVSLVVAINQFSFAFGPTLLARLQDAAGTYRPALLACLAMEIAAAVVVLLPTTSRRRY